MFGRTPFRLHYDEEKRNPLVFAFLVLQQFPSGDNRKSEDEIILKNGDVDVDHYTVQGGFSVMCTVHCYCNFWCGESKIEQICVCLFVWSVLSVPKDYRMYPPLVVKGKTNKSFKNGCCLPKKKTIVLTLQGRDIVRMLRFDFDLNIKNMIFPL